MPDGIAILPVEAEPQGAGDGVPKAPPCRQLLIESSPFASLTDQILTPPLYKLFVVPSSHQPFVMSSLLLRSHGSLLLFKAAGRGGGRNGSGRILRASIARNPASTAPVQGYGP